MRKTGLGFGTATLLTCLLLTPRADAGTPPEGLPRLDPAIANQTVSLQFEEATPVRMIYRALADHAGFEVSFDPRLKDHTLMISFDELDVMLALDRIATAAGQFWQPIDSTAVVVADDTPQNRRNYELQVIRTFDLEHVRPAEMMTVLRSVISLKSVAVSEDGQTLTMRDTVNKVAIAERIIDRLDQPRQQIILDLELIRVPRARFADLRALAGDEMLRLDNEARRRLRADATVINEPTLSIVAGESARHRMSERLTRSDAPPLYFELDLAFDARPHASRRSVTLGIEARSRLAAEDGVVSSRDAQSSITVGNEESVAFFDWLPLENDARDEMSILIVRPRILDRADHAQQTAGFVIGTESAARRLARQTAQ